jgi:hypothetical protein
MHKNNLINVSFTKGLIMPTIYSDDQDNPDSDETRLEDEERLRRYGIRRGELSDEEIKSFDDDKDSYDGGGGMLHDDGEDLSDVVPPEEQDGND